MSNAVTPILDNTASYAGWASEFSASLGPEAFPATAFFGVISVSSSAMSYALKPTPIQTSQDLAVDVMNSVLRVRDVYKPFVQQSVRTLITIEKNKNQ